MQDIGHSLGSTFHEGRFTVGQLNGPLTLMTLEPVDGDFEAMAPGAGHGLPAGRHQFWFYSLYLHHLLAMATDSTVDNTVEVAILDRRLALTGHAPQGRPARVVRLSTAVLAHDRPIDVAIGRVAEQPEFVPRGVDAAAPGALRAAVQHLVRRHDIEYCLRARSLHWIEIRPSRGRDRGAPPGR